MRVPVCVRVLLPPFGDPTFLGSGPHPSGAPPSGAPHFGAPLFGAPLFWVWGPTLRGVIVIIIIIVIIVVIIVIIVIIVITIVIRILIIYFGFKKIGLSDRPPHSPASQKFSLQKIGIGLSSIGLSSKNRWPK